MEGNGTEGAGGWRNSYEGRYGGDQDIIFKHGLGDAHWTREMPNKQSDMSLELRVQGQDK